MSNRQELTSPLTTVIPKSEKEILQWDSAVGIITLHYVNSKFPQYGGGR